MARYRPRTPLRWPLDYGWGSHRWRWNDHHDVLLEAQPWTTRPAVEAGCVLCLGQFPTPLGTVVALIQAGRLRLLAVGTPARLPQFPDVPTFAEAGLPGFTFNSWFALVAPAGTPKPIVARLNHEMTQALAHAPTREKLLALGVTPRGSSAADFAVALQAQYELYRKLIQDRGIKAD